MRRLLLILVIGLLMSLSLGAVPAHPRRFRHRQADGTVLLLQRHGDEFFHWTTDASGQVVAPDEAGNYRPAVLDMQARRRGEAMRREARRLRPRPGGSDPLTHGTRHIPVFLIQFADRAFRLSDPVAQFDALLNQHGYAQNGGTGSVQDYYVDNSRGAYKPVFDVFRIITLKQDMKYYGDDSDGNKVPFAVADAAKALDAEVDFSQYDADGDGYVDMCLVYYAGYNEAEGGSVHTIWPHQGWVSGDAQVKLDGKYLGRYFCTSELKGYSGTQMCGIGTTCHEFAHSLGLPDFYDTDGADNGKCGGLYRYSLMCNGSYVNEGNTPPYLNAQERLLLGWIGEQDIPEIQNGENRLTRVPLPGSACRSFTDTEGEYFLYEYRDGTGWDRFLPRGMVIYHVDMSDSHLIGDLPARQQWLQWEYHNCLNAYGDHPCFYLVPSADPTNLLYDNIDEAGLVFPGSGNVTRFNPVGWEEGGSSVTLSDIRIQEGSGASFTALYLTRRSVSGLITDRWGAPVSGVHVVLSALEEEETGVQGLRLRVAPRSLPDTPYEATSDAQGYFCVDVQDFAAAEALIRFSREGYVTASRVVNLSARGVNLSLSLRRPGEGDWKDMAFFDTKGRQYYDGSSENSCMAAIRLTPDILAPYAGYQVAGVQFGLYADTADALSVVADLGDTRLFTYPVPDGDLGGYICVTDLSPLDYRLPKLIRDDLYVGYAVQNARVEYDYDARPAVITRGSGNYYYAPYDLEKCQWQQRERLDLVFILTLEDPGDGVAPPGAESLAGMGVNCIDPGTGPYRDGDRFYFRLVEAPSDRPVSVSWRFDGTAPSSDSVVLTSGTHQVSALLRYADGSKERLDWSLQVQ